MRRHATTKIQRLAVRHPGLREKVYAMFAEFWPARAVVRLVQAQYGERLGLRSVERYKSQHWRGQRDLIQEMGMPASLVVGS